MIYVNEIESGTTFKIKTGYYLEILTPQTMKLLRSTKSKITKDENGENMPHLQITKVVLVHFNIVNNDYRKNSRTLYKFVPNKSFGQLLDIYHENYIFLKTFNSESLCVYYVFMWFTDQNSKLLEIEYKINMTIVIN